MASRLHFPNGSLPVTHGRFLQLLGLPPEVLLRYLKDTFILEVLHLIITRIGMVTICLFITGWILP